MYEIGGRQWKIAQLECILSYRCRSPSLFLLMLVCRVMVCWYPAVCGCMLLLPVRLHWCVGCGCTDVSRCGVPVFSCAVSADEF